MSEDSDVQDAIWKTPREEWCRAAKADGGDLPVSVKGRKWKTKGQSARIACFKPSVDDEVSDEVLQHQIVLNSENGNEISRATAWLSRFQGPQL